MDFILFNLISTLENAAMFSLMLALYRFKIKDYAIHILFSSFLIAQMSYYVRVLFDMGNLVPIFAILLTVLLVWLMFRVQIFYAAIISVTGYVAYGVVQAVILYGAITSGLVLREKVIPFTPTAYFLQIISALAAFGVSVLLLKKRYGFTFVPYSETAFVKLKEENFLFLALIIITILLTAINFSWLGLNNLFSGILLFIITLVALIYLAMKKEKKND